MTQSPGYIYDLLGNVVSVSTLFDGSLITLFDGRAALHYMTTEWEAMKSQSSRAGATQQAECACQ